MSDIRSLGRWIGAGVLFGYAADITVNFFLFPGIRIGEGAMGLFLGGAKNGDLVAQIVLASLASDMVGLLVAGLVFSAGRAGGAVWLAASYLAVKAAAVGMSGLELASLQTVRSIGEAIAGQAPAQAETLANTLNLVISGLRDGAHFPRMMTGGFSAMLLYLILLTTRFVPWPLAGAGVLACMCQMGGVAAGVLVGEASFVLLLPLFFVQLALALWLLVFGFRAPNRA